MKDAHAESNEKSDFSYFYFSSYGHCMVYFMVIAHLSCEDGHFWGGYGGGVLHIFSWETSKILKHEFMRRQFVLRQLRCFPDPQSNQGEGHFGAAVSALDNWVPCRFGTVHFGAVSYFFFCFSSYEEKTMKQEIPWMPLSANLFRLESTNPK